MFNAVQNIFGAETEMTTLTESGLKAGLLGLGQILHDARLKSVLWAS